MNPIPRAGIIAPLTVVPMSVLLVAGEKVLSRHSTELKSVIDGVMLLGGAGLIFAYTAMLLVGIPGYMVAKRFGQANYPMALLAATLASAIAASMGGFDSGYLPALGFFMIFAVPIALSFTTIVRHSPIATTGH
jgi:hypothetical protein